MWYTVSIIDRYSKINTDSFSGHRKCRIRAEFSVYTDCSKPAEGTGSGFVVYKQNTRIHIESINLPDHSTVFQAEITAIYEACQYMIANLNDLGVN